MKKQLLPSDYIFPDDYDEAAELQKLLLNMHALPDPDDLTETEIFRQYIAVVINGKIAYFYVGGPQLEAVCQFIKQIAKENGYRVNFKENTVK